MTRSISHHPWTSVMLTFISVAVLILMLLAMIDVLQQAGAASEILAGLRTLQAIPILTFLFTLISVVLVVVGLLTSLYFPLSLSFEFSRRDSIFLDTQPRVSVIIPAFNESQVLKNCVVSVLRSDYPDFEVILVDDGSTDETLSIMKSFEGNALVKVIGQKNRGKAAALNTGMQASNGEVLFFVDADGIFKPDTIRQMLAGFTSERVGAVCGNDEPVNVDRLQTRLLCVQSHIGTGFVRRALARINCLPIVSGNIGAFRRQALAAAIYELDRELVEYELPFDLRPFREGFIGEDLELTWRVHAAGYEVNFAPDAFVLAEAPSSLGDLWKQRVRWARGFLQTARIHRRLFFNLKRGLIGLYLPVNYFNMVILPFLQLAVILLLGVLSLAGYAPLALDLLGLILWLGVGTTLFASLWSISLDHAWRCLLYTSPSPRDGLLSRMPSSA